ncbi:MAG: UDP-glucose/GDP-mannose dehydrogenase family protein [Firmicutes bacterium]|nr:UDP-glucose/GDP-mannose dehydrogenase family protein [Bacillota bacterium]
MNVAVIGCGYVGLTTGAALAWMGHRVYCADRDPSVVGLLNDGKIHLYEPDLDRLVSSAAGAGRLRFTTSTAEAIVGAEVALVCAGTPSSPDGSADLSQVKDAYECIARAPGPRRGALVVATKSTVPPGTCSSLAARYGSYGMRICSNPEFLREGTAVRDALHPDRVVIGSDDPVSTQVLCELYMSLGRPLFVVSPIEAELIKYAANSFLAARISFINEFAELCEAVGADVTRVAAAAGADPRIGASFMQAGIGFGGPCLPKDLKALVSAGRDHGVAMDILEQVERRNSRQRARAVERIARALGGLEGRIVAVWGVTFKPGAGDTRESPPVDVARVIMESGASVRFYDPAVETPVPGIEGAVCCDSPYEAVRGAHALALLTEWDEFRWVDWGLVRRLMEGDFVFDGRNALSPAVVRAMGFEYAGVGRRTGGTEFRHVHPGTP